MCFVRQVVHNKAGEVWTVDPQTSVYRALELMAEKNVGAVPVMDGEKLVGMFSERDYARKIILKGRSSKGTAVRDVMSQPVYSVSPDETVDTCMQLMTDRHVRHLPVMENGELVAILSIGDLLKATVKDQRVLIRDLENFIVGDRC